MGFIHAECPSASYQQPKVHDVKKFVASFARPSAPSAARSRSRTPKHLQSVGANTLQHAQCAISGVSVVRSNENAEGRRDGRNHVQVSRVASCST